MLFNRSKLFIFIFLTVTVCHGSKWPSYLAKAYIYDDSFAKPGKARFCTHRKSELPISFSSNYQFVRNKSRFCY